MTNIRIYELSKKEDALIIAGIAMAGLILSYLLYRNIFFAPLIFLLYRPIRKFAAEYLAEKRRREYIVQFKDFLFMASTAIGAGRSIKDAIGESIPSLQKIHGRKAILPSELEKVYARLEIGGESDTDVLMDMAMASGMEDVYDFVSVYSICKKTGASLIVALNRAASVIIDKMTIEREIEELIRRKKSEGMVIFIMPVLVILFLNLCAPDYIAPMYETAAGRIIMTSVAAAGAGIYAMIQRIVKVDI